MKMIVVVALAFVALAAAAPAEDPNFEILRSSFEQQPEGPYTFSFEGKNGITRNEQGELKEVVGEDDKPHVVVVVRGEYSYPGEDGKPVLVSYIADENGYKAVGDSIPKLQE